MNLVGDRLVAALLLPALLALPVAARAAERRCGWLENPTPANFSLRDRNGEWLLAKQGGYQAEGMDIMPDMTKAGWVETNVHYGYGCACLTVVTDRRRQQVTRILSAQPVPLARCRADQSLPRP